MAVVRHTDFVVADCSHTDFEQAVVDMVVSVWVDIAVAVRHTDFVAVDIARRGVVAVDRIGVDIAVDHIAEASHKRVVPSSSFAVLGERTCR